jgi:hypothetical protein
LKKRTSRQRQSFWSYFWLDERRECNRKKAECWGIRATP